MQDNTKIARYLHLSAQVPNTDIIRAFEAVVKELHFYLEGSEAFGAGRAKSVKRVVGCSAGSDSMYDTILCLGSGGEITNKLDVNSASTVVIIEHYSFAAMYRAQQGFSQNDVWEGLRMIAEKLFAALQPVAVKTMNESRLW